MQPRSTSGIYGTRLADLIRAISELRDNGATSAVLEGNTYHTTDLPRLYGLAELWTVKAAIEAILGGAQSYTIEGMSYTRADLNALMTRETRIEGKAARAARARAGGTGIRYGVPH